ncbi:MAG: DDE-type integrase/transposase/recombinase [Thaumarchaeota archaeon]|nr:DDE-type integrase/transposase/recombinase [Nitrososphaerota archaeon]
MDIVDPGDKEVGETAGVRRVRPNRISCTGYYVSRHGYSIPYESVLERDFFLLCDFEPQITKITAQPFRIGKHTPDACLETMDGKRIVVDVKPEAILIRKWSKYAAAFASTAEYCEGQGYSYAFFTDALRTDQRHRLAVLKEIHYNAQCEDSPALEVSLQSDLENRGPTTVMTLLENLDSKMDPAVAKRALSKLIFGMSAVVLDTPKPFLEDAVVSAERDGAKAQSIIIPYSRVLKRLETHPLRFLGDSAVNYYERMHELTLAGHHYEVLDSSAPEDILVSSSENGERYRVCLDKIPAAGGKLSTLALERPELFDRIMQRWDGIRGLVSLPRRTKEDFRKVAGTLGLSPRQVRRLIRRVESYGPEGLAPLEGKGGKGGIRIERDVDEIVRRVIEEEYLTTRKPTVAQIYKDIQLRIADANRLRHSNEELKVPHMDTIYRRVHAIHPQTKAEKREGIKFTSDRFGVYGGRFPDSTRPLQTVLIDHTPLDVRVVESTTGRPISRVWITALIDAYSRMVGGFMLNLTQPNANDVGLVILQCALSKDNEVRQHELMEWPIQGVPWQLHFDNGKDFRSRSIAAGCAEFGINIMHRPVGTPRFGGYIERFYRTLEQGYIHDFPGTTKSDPDERGIYDSDKEARLTIDKLEALVWKSIDEYHITPHSELGMTPLQKWKEGVRSHPPRQLSQDQTERFRMAFLPMEERTIQKDGIHFGGCEYYSPDLISLLSTGLGKGNEKRKIRHDPLDVRYIYVFDKKEFRYHRLTCGVHERISRREFLKARKERRTKAGFDPSEANVVSQYRKRVAELEKDDHVQSKRTLKEREIIRRENSKAERFAKTKATTQKEEPKPSALSYKPSSMELSGKVRIKNDGRTG